MKFFIKKVLLLGLWTSLDIQFANMLAFSVFNSYTYHAKQHKKKSALILASACLSAHIRLGHTCLPLHLLSSTKLFPTHYPELIQEAMQKTGNLSTHDWQELLFSLSAIGDGSYTSPLVLENQRLYLHRIWQDECIVAQFLSNSYRNPQSIHTEKITNILNTLFPKNLTQNNWHKIATAIGMTQSRVFISGGPGTGKTTIVFKIIVALLLYNHKARIQILAPTGKAAAILTHSFHSMLNNISQYTHNSYINKFTLHATTLHNLLGPRLYKNQNEYNHNIDILGLDFLIIDEASMIGLSILSRLILSLPHSINIILLGDHNQLCSVDPGSVFKDIYQFANFNYSVSQQHRIKELTGCILPIFNHSNITQSDHYNITDGICTLKKNYRFHKNSGIAKLAVSINAGNHNHVLSILHSNIYTDVFYFSYTDKNYINMIMQCASKYYNYLQKIKNNKTISIKKILKIFNKYQILCALKQGPFGVIRINYYIELILHYKGFITLNNSSNYIGKPIIILQNAPSIGLWNGDIGILLLNTQNQLSAYFLKSENTIKIIQLSQLPKHTSCFAITIHKSQGSEFQSIAVILPNLHLPILTRELLYTAVTRAQQQVLLYATDEVIIQSINSVTQRHSGLYEKIKKYSTIKSINK